MSSSLGCGKFSQRHPPPNMLFTGHAPECHRPEAVHILITEPPGPE